MGILLSCTHTEMLGLAEEPNAFFSRLGQGWKTGYLFLTNAQYFLNRLVCLELVLWFFSRLLCFVL